MTESIRVSVGTAALLNLLNCKIDALPTTAYTMTHTKHRCSANCAFCAQARQSSSEVTRLSRITWPTFSLSAVIRALSESVSRLEFQRLCIQTICYPALFDDLKYLIESFRNQIPHIPLSLALPPLRREQFQHFFDAGVDRVAIALDAVTPEIFACIKGRGVNGPFTWKTHHEALNTARSIFGKDRTTTHLIIGLGETEKQAINLIQNLTDRGITVGLFSFTPLAGTPLEHQDRPSIRQYRRIQLAHYLIRNQISRFEEMKFNSNQNQLIGYGTSTENLNEILMEGKAFQTAGCPSCNRPFFTETPRGPLYNYPIKPTTTALKEIRNQLGGEI